MRRGDLKEPHKSASRPCRNGGTGLEAARSRVAAAATESRTIIRNRRPSVRALRGARIPAGPPNQRPPQLTRGAFLRQYRPAMMFFKR